ncbi:MAG: acyl-CoA thioesterase [Ruminococcaceae bacterium]|nr:acyl-CoA thioesterase [Oscillospiraceae bacterium]
MRYTEKYNVRWHDTDANRKVRPSGVLMFMQETANRQFEAAGRPLDRIRDEEGVGFILSRIAIEMMAPIHAYEDITVATFTCESKGFTFPRGFEVKRGETVVARAMSQWALVRVADKALVRAVDFPMSFGNEPELALEMPLRFRLPKDLFWETVGYRNIVFSDIDYNMHMNNTKYPDMLCDFLPDPAHTG